MLYLHLTMKKTDKWYHLLLRLCLCGAVLLLCTRALWWKETVWPKRAISVDAVVVSEPQVKTKTMTVDLFLTASQRKVRAVMVRDGRSERIRLGDGLVVKGRFCPIHRWQQGNFDYQRHMRSQGYTGEVFASSGYWTWRAVELRRLGTVQRVRLKFLLLRHRLLTHYEGMEPATYGVLAAMTLGDRSALDKGLREVYARTGASHVLALSGLHLMIIYAMVSLLVTWRRYRLLAQALLVVTIWMYAFLVGLPSSVIRSATMITVYTVLSSAHRTRRPLRVLTFTAVVMLLVHPAALFDLGFQLSFAAVGSILLFGPLFQQMIPSPVLRRYRLIRYLWGLTTVSVSAQLGTAPLVAYYFGRLPVYFLLTNFVAIPLVTLILYEAMLLFAVGWIAALSPLLTGGLSVTVTLLNRLLGIIGRWPGASIDVRIGVLQLLLLYLIVACLYVLLTYSLTSGGYRSGWRPPSIR